MNMFRKCAFALIAAMLAAPAAFAEDDGPAFSAVVPEGFEGSIERYNYSPATRAGDFVFLAGVVASLPADENGDMIEATEENLVAAYENAFQRIETILNETGASWRDVVEMTTYHTDDIRAQVDAFMIVKKRYHAEPYPAWTAIDIDRLFSNRGVTEIRVIAYAPVKSE